MGGLMDYHARFYSSALGRFTQPDTVIPDLSNPQNGNRYTYVLNSPIGNNDPTGHWVETVFDVVSLGMTINDIRNEGFTAWNVVSLVTDVAAVILPVVPAGASHLIRAAKYSSKAVNAVDTAADAAKLVDKADDILDVAKKAPIVIGETMDRVREYANLIGADYYKPHKIDPYIPSIHDPISQARNNRWIEDMMNQGREIIDIGPDFPKRLIDGASDWYEIERKAIVKKGYENYRKVFDRFNRFDGGVPGLDF